MWLTVMFLPQILISIFTSDQQFIYVTKWALRIYMGAILLFGIQIACQQTFISLGQAKVSVFLAVLRKIILLIPLIFILPNLINYNFALKFIPDTIAALFSQPNKVLAVFLAEPIADFGAVLFTAVMFKLNFKKILLNGAK